MADPSGTGPVASLELHKLDRDEFVKSILDKSSKNSRLHKHVQGDEIAVSEMTRSYLPPAPRQVTFRNKSNVDIEFEKALATPPPRIASSTDPAVMNSRVAPLSPSIPKLEVSAANEDDLELESTIMVRKGEDMELPVAVIIPKSVYETCVCELNYNFSTDAGDIQWTMLHVKDTNVQGDGSPRPATNYGGVVNELQSLQRANTSQDPTEGSLTLTESCTVVLRWSNKFLPQKAQRVRYVVKMSYKREPLATVSSNIDDKSVPELAFSPSWTQADRLEKVMVSPGNNSQQSDGHDEDLVSEDAVIETLRSHISGLEHQLYAVIEHNKAMTVEEGAQLDALEALVERHKAGNEATRQALVTATKQNKWMRDALEGKLRKRGSFSDVATSKPDIETDDDDDTVGDAEPDEGGDSNVEWNDEHGAPGAPAASTGTTSAGKRAPSIPQSLDPTLTRLEQLQGRLEAVQSRMTSARMSHALHQQQLSSHHHFYSNALKLKAKEIERSSEARDEAIEAAKETRAELELARDAVKRLAVSEARLQEDVSALKGQVEELTRQVQAKQQIVSQLEADKVALVATHDSDKKALVAAHEKKADDTELFHDQQRNHLYTQLGKIKEELEKHKAESSMARIDLDKERKDKELQLRRRDEDLEHVKRLNEEEKTQLAAEKDRAHAQELKEKAIQHAEDLQQAHATHATAAAQAIATATVTASQGGSPGKQPSESPSPVIRSLQELASSSPAISAGPYEGHQDSIRAIDGAHKRASDAEKALEALRVTSKAREGKLLDRYSSLTDKYNDLLLRMEDQRTALQASEEEAARAQELISQATGALSELKFKASKHDEVSEANRSLTETLLLLKEEHLKVRSDLNANGTELSASKAREQQYAEKIAQMDAASPRKILDRNKSQIGQLQKQLDGLGEERRDLVHMVELLNEEKHHRDQDYAKQHLESSARISDLASTVDELTAKKGELQDRCEALELRAMQGREAQTKVIDLSGTVGDLEAVLKHREASSRKMEAEIAALKDERVKTSGALTELEDKLKASEERNVASASQAKSLSLANSRLEKDVEALEAANTRALDDAKAKSERALADKALVFERELRQAQEEHNRATASLESRLVAALKRVEDTESQAARDVEAALKRAEHHHAAETENLAQRHSVALEDMKIRHSAELTDLKARHARVLEGERAEASEEVKTLEMEKAKMKAALQAFREESKGEMHLLEMRSQANAALHSQVETLKGEMEALQARYDGQKSVIEKMKVELSSDSERLHNDDFELRNLRKERKEAQSRENAREAMEERLHMKIGEQEKALSALRAEVRRGEESKILLQTSAEQLRSDLATSTMRLTHQEEQQDQQEARHRQQLERLELENATLLSMVNETKAALAMDESRLRRMEEAKVMKGAERDRRTAAAIAAASEPLMTPRSTGSIPASAPSSSHSTPTQVPSISTASLAPGADMQAPNGEPLTPAPAPVEEEEKEEEEEETAAYRARLLFIYSQYAPEKVKSISSVMDMYKGQDGRHHLFIALRRKYLSGEHASDGHVLATDEANYSDDEDEREQKRENRVRAKQVHAAFDEHLGHVQAMQAIASLAQSPAPAPVRTPAPAAAPAPTVDTANAASEAAGKQQASPVSQSPHSVSHLQKIMQTRRGTFDPHNPHPHFTAGADRWSPRPTPPDEHSDSPYDRKPVEHHDSAGFEEEEEEEGAGDGDRHDDDDQGEGEPDKSFEAVSSQMNNLVGL